MLHTAWNFYFGKYKSLSPTHYKIKKAPSVTQNSILNCLKYMSIFQKDIYKLCVQDCYSNCYDEYFQKVKYLPFSTTDSSFMRL